ncbi:hypothetical protein QBC34DRAFT_469582 [Podospora aff. communis PSN243]|uniref:NodB homology domain-containing protein n=1 Tax=Podospora aff. communis PSN243 TaxID=3040156 RepID=A0AAV9GEL5_9PEZI|nr:hypothetical protein QBC34DRAFT_469582 [Podospora aff. communis PSN243]
MPTPQARWPNSARCAISFTMDNLGEAQDVLNSRWPHPIGSHPSITAQLPRLLSLLDSHSLRATYFVEAWSLSVYPDVIKELRSRGHEVAWHGYQHEVWKSLTEDEERESFRKTFEAAKEAGVEYRGFRPPGGEVNGRTWGMLKEKGVRYVSDVDKGEFGVGKEGVVVLPFEWKCVDAFYYMEKHGGGRVREPGEFREWVMGRIEEVKREGGYLSILAHPFLTTSEEKMGVVDEILKKLAEDGEVWCAPCGEVADWVEGHKEWFKMKERE